MDEITCRETALRETDPQMAHAIEAERRRQHDHLDLIASENYCSEAVREAVGSVLTDKYAEGYPGARWYGGCECVDVVEQLVIARAKELFGAEHANVQAHSGSQANMAVYTAALRPGARVLGMSLTHGGHLTHGHKHNFSGAQYLVMSYGVSRDTCMIDYDEVRQLAEQHNPDLIIAGASAYPRAIDFEKFREIADQAGAILMVDMAHIAGLIAARLHPDPVPHADYVTSSTHKTLRGPRSGFVLCKEEHAKELDAAIFPGVQGGPMMHVIAAKGVAFLEALRPEFREYQRQILANARAMADEFMGLGVSIVSGGTDNHLMLLDLSSYSLSGVEVTKLLALANITVNKNVIPFDTRSPAEASGIRIGTPAVTTRGMVEADVRRIAGWVVEVLSARNRAAAAKALRPKVVGLCEEFPVRGF